MFSQIIATGSYLPEKLVTNADLTQFPPDSIPLIASKTGVHERRYADPEQSTSDLAAIAAQQCLVRSGIAATELDGIILATSSPDQPMPATSAMVQAKIGATAAFAVDVNAVCTGGVYALRIADAMIRAGCARRILVIASEVYSRILNQNDFSSCPYFGDGAGAMLLESAEQPTHPFINGGVLHSDGTGADFIKIPAGGSRLPFSKMTDNRQQFFQMNGKAVFEFAVTRGAEVIEELCRQNSITKDRLTNLILHQANINILAAIAERTSLPLERFIVNLDRYGNTAAASTLIAFDEMMTKTANQLKNDVCFIVAFGGGLSWGGITIEFP